MKADPNRPLTTGDNLWADKDSRGEIHIGSTAIRTVQPDRHFIPTARRSHNPASARTGDDSSSSAEFPLSGDAFEVDTPNLALTLTQPGEYRIETDPNGGSTMIVVREGAEEATGGGDTWNLGPTPAIHIQRHGPAYLR